MAIRQGSGDVSGDLTLSSPLTSSQHTAPTPPFVRPLKEWAVITVGRRPGVFFQSKTLMRNVDGIPGSSVVKFYTQDGANAAFSAALDEGLVTRVVMKHERQVVLPTETLPGMDAVNLVNISTTDPMIFHVVFVGRNPGIFTDRDSVNANIIHIPYARCEKYTSYAQARSDFVGLLESGQITRVSWSVARQTLSRSDFSSSFLESDI